MPEAAQELPRDPEELRAIIAQTTTRQAEKDGVRGHMDWWAHVRRKAVEGANSQTKTVSAHAFVTLIGKLYSVERGIRGTAPEHRHAVRLEKSQPILDEIKAWLADKAQKVVPKGTSWAMENASSIFPAGAVQQLHRLAPWRFLRIFS